MDTKLKKSHKLATFLITVSILIPALLLTMLYPSITEAVQKKEKEYEEKYGLEEEEVTYALDDSFLDHALKASYGIYGDMLLLVHEENVDYRVYNRYGWNNAFENFKNTVRYEASYPGKDGEMITLYDQFGPTEDAAITGEVTGELTLVFDEYGTLHHANLEGDFVSNYWMDEISVRVDIHNQEYYNYVLSYEENYLTEVDEEQLVPKNIVITFRFNEDCEYVNVYNDIIYHSTQDLLLDVGAVWIIALAALFVAMMALVLPFFKSLNTGWEKIFSMPFEVIVGIAGITIAGGTWMFFSLCEMMTFSYSPDIWILTTQVSEKVQYLFLQVLSFFGWALVFFGEYIVVSSFRQFLCAPIRYIKERPVLFIFFRWVKKKSVKLYEYVTDIDISKNLNNSIVKVVLINFVILTILCCLWLFGVAGLIVYSVLLYILLRKFGKKIQDQYNSVLKATEQMAEGDLNIHMEEELGVFQPIGDSLGRVQRGFEKAVVEEAKSQNMKTELITNVSHDLKTPLTAIITYVDLLKKEGITEEERASYIRTIEQKSQRLKALIEDLFEVSKAQSGNVNMNLMDIDVVNLMKQVRTEMSDQLEASTLTFRWNLPEEKLILKLDGQRTYRVFENLLNNALKYAMPYSRVYVDIVQNEKQIQVMMRNMSAQELDFDAERLTERFVRGDSSRNSEGSGLGLAIAKSFVELQQGEFKIDVDGDLFKVIITWEK